MRMRRMRVAGGGECVALWDGGRWRPLGPVLRRDSSAGLERAAGDLVALLGGGPELWQEAREALARAGEAEVELPALLPFTPRSFRDFSLWERHMVDAARGIARRFLPARRWRAVEAYERATGRTFPRLKPGANWYQRPIYYKGSHLAFLPDGATVPWPSYTQALDYELELGVVIARPLHDATPEQALAAIGGFVLVCDWSARDVQIPEMSQGGFGPAKSKDFANSLGAEVVSADELLDRLDALDAEVRVNGETWGRGSTAGMRYTIAEMVAYASLGERLHPGELLATGTVPGCSGAEVDRWLSPGDRVELELAGLGTLHATIGGPQPAGANGNLGRARWNVVPRGGFGPEVPAVEPRRWDPPRALPLTGALAVDTRLDEVQRWEVPGGRKPEDVVFDAAGRAVTGVEDGRIYRFAPDGARAELLADTHGRPLGLEFDAEGRLLVCDAYRGLLRVADGAVEVLVDSFQGRRLRFVNNAAVGPDGTVYFSDSSTRFDIAHYPLDALEHRGNGRLFAYHPGTGGTELLADGLYFPNGVALAPDASFLLVAETWRYQVQRVWLQGPNAGLSEVLVDRLPGFPDNLSARGDGTYWLALPDQRQPRIDALLPRPAARRTVAALPARLRPGPSGTSVVVRFDADGVILDSLHGPGGSYTVVTGVREHAGHLYLGSLAETAIARVRL